MDKIISFVCYRLLPKKVLYFAFIKVVADVTTGEYSNTVVPELYALEALDRFGKKHDIHIK